MAIPPARSAHESYLTEEDRADLRQPNRPVICTECQTLLWRDEAGNIQSRAGHRVDQT